MPYGRDYPDGEVTGPAGIGLGAFIDSLRGWLDLPDPAHVTLTMAVAATRNLDGEAAWLLIVAAPSSGKTETVRLLDDVADGKLNEVTAAGLLGWSKGKVATPTGVLARLGSRALVTFGDLSSLLATSDKGGRDQVFALLRKAYDGEASRDVSPPGRTDAAARLAWTGRLTVVACVTGVIDRYTAHNDALGPRWLYVRIADRDTAGKRRAARAARRGDLPDRRKAARTAIAVLVAEARDRIGRVTVPDNLADHIEDAALVTCWGRAAVPRHGYGAREIDDVATVEEPPRLVQQLHTVARGLLALGVSEYDTTGLLRRCALDSMPTARRAVLDALSLGEPLTGAALAAACRLDRGVARRAAEELEAVGIVRGRTSDGGRDSRVTVTWELAADDDGALVSDVFAAHRQQKVRSEKREPTPLPPQERAGDTEATLFSERISRAPTSAWSLLGSAS